MSEQEQNMLMKPNAHISALIVASISDDDASMNSETEFEFESRTDLDSHANMFVAGKHAFILADSGRTATVRAFSPDMEAIETPIVNCAFLYECSYTNQIYT
jgi:predicted DNA binding CopG/RHH family protein